MIQSLLLRTFRDALPMLIGCSVLIMGNVLLRLWVVAQIDFAEAASLFADILPKFIERLLPVPFETIASIEGRVSFGHEEAPVILLTSLWAVTRGTDCLAGRLGEGTMEMILAQPVRRFTVVATHTAVTLLGTVLIALAAWLGIGIGIAIVGFDEPTTTMTYWPATANLMSLGIFLIGISTLVSSVARTRSQAVGLVVGFIVIEMACKIMGMMSPQVAWLKKLTFLSAYEPTLLTTGMIKDPATYGSLLWQYNFILIGIGLAALALGTAIFCRRDLPAPL